MTKTMSRSAVVSIALTFLFAAVIVGGPYAYLITRACEPTSFSEFVSDVSAFHTREGC